MNMSYNISEAGAAPYRPNYDVITNLVVAWCISLFGIVSNVLLLRVTYKSKGMFPTQHLLGISDLVFSFAYFTAAPPLIYWELMGMTFDQVSMLVVFFYPWPHLFNASWWWTGFLTLALSFERFVASVFPIWYNQNWDDRKSNFYAVIYVVLALMLVPGYVAFFKICVEKGTMFRFGGSYQILSALPYLMGTQQTVGQLEALCSVILSVLALVLGRRKRAELGVIMNETWIAIEKKMERTVLAVVTCTIFLIALPNFLAFLVNTIFESGNGRLPDWIYVVRRYVTCLMVVNSAINFWLYIALHSGFRAQARGHILGKASAFIVPTMTAPSAPSQPISTRRQRGWGKSVPVSYLSPQCKVPGRRAKNIQ